MQITRRNWFSICALAMVLALAASTAIFAYQWHIRREAQSLLRDLVALRVGESNVDEAEHLAQKYRAYFVEKNCDGGSCSYVFIIGNGWLSRLRLAPTAQFRSVLTVEKGVITRSGAALMRETDLFPTFPSSAGSVEEYVEVSGAGTDHYGFATPVGKPHLRVLLDRNASVQDRLRAYAFSFNCLTKVGGGCNLPCDYLPEAWQDWKTQLLGNGFPIRDFDRFYPDNKRCER